jgi:hypothetical protein
VNHPPCQGATKSREILDRGRRLFR